MKFHSSILRPACCAFLMATAGMTLAQPPQAMEDALKLLNSPVAEERVGALQEFDASIDPRLPALVLPLLKDEDGTVRRLAARAIGNVWRQIPDGQKQRYVNALRKNAESDDERERNMARRAIGLLTRDYGGPMFALSPDRRRVIYERWMLPCVLDIEDGSEELPGQDEPGLDSIFSAAFEEREVTPCVLWHPDSKMAAIEMMSSRSDVMIWVLRDGHPVLKFDWEDLIHALGLEANKIRMPGGAGIRAQRWQGDRLVLEATYTTINDDENETEWRKILTIDAAPGGP